LFAAELGLHAVVKHPVRTGRAAFADDPLTMITVTLVGAVLSVPGGGRCRRQVAAYRRLDESPGSVSHTWQ
jgi:hypothetical protein